MANEPMLLADLRTSFPDAPLDINCFRGEWSLVVAAKDQLRVLKWLQGCEGDAMDTLVDLTAVDRMHMGRGPRYEVVYQLRSSSSAFRLRIKVPLDTDTPKLPSAVSLWPAAAWLEREVYDMFGIRFPGHPDLRRLLLPEGCDGHPLRKDFLADGSVAVVLSRDNNDASECRDAGSIAVDFGCSPLHPGMPGSLRAQMEFDGERITELGLDLGFVHSGVEKLGESQSYMQFGAVGDRINYQSPFCTNLAFVLCVERLLDLAAPKRAQYGRVVLAELGRIGEHLIWLTAQARQIAAYGLFQLVDTHREALCDVYEAVGGTRWMTGFVRIGGLATDLPSGFVSKVSAFLAGIRDAVDEIRATWDGNGVWLKRSRGVGTLGVAEARSWGLSGPVARAAGINCDLRKDEPYCSYEDFDFEIPVGVIGDVYDRYQVRVQEMVQSSLIIRQALRDFPEGEFAVTEELVRRPDQIQDEQESASMIHHFKLWMEGHGIQPPPDVDSYMPTESPNGELGCFIVSDGSDRPYRLRLRAPSFLNYQLFERIAPGLTLSDALVVLGSFNVVAGEVDR